MTAHPRPLPATKPHRPIGRLRTSNYDISSICNLRCEGCLFFSGADEASLTATEDLGLWQAFFHAEAARGINFAYVAGAEPSLTPDRIRACHDHIPMGAIFTNGTKRIDPDISYRIHVSLWGNEARSELYRGASVNRRAMRNYAGDPRAIFVMTLNRLNLAEIPEVAAACADHGVVLTFSLFSPTTDYNQRMAAAGAGENAAAHAGKTDYFRFSSQAQDMRFDAATLARAHDAMLEAAAAFPGTVKISPAYLRWVTQGGSLYTLDAEGLATDCGNRLTLGHRHHNPDLSRNSGKCCSPNLDCRDCRAYAMSLATYFRRRRQMPEDWAEVWTFWADCFLPVAGD